MSLKLVRKFLQADDQAVNSSEVVSNKKQSKKRRRRRRENEDITAATESDLLEATVQGMLYLDRTMATHTGKTDSKNCAMKRINAESKRAKKKRKKLLENDTMIGNSRSSSSQLRLPTVSTFNKKKHKQELEEKRLRDIAKILSSKKMKNATKKAAL